MKKLPFIIFGVFFTTIEADALICVSNTDAPSNPSSKQFVERYKGSYLQCGGTGDPFFICKNGTVVHAYDGNLYKCNNKVWEKINPKTISDCTTDMTSGGLAEVENQHEGLSNLGSLGHDGLDQTEFVYYFHEAPNVGYSAITDYCKYPMTNFDALLNECDGTFMDWATESGSVIPCNTKYNESLTITVQDTFSTPLSEAIITYKGQTYTTNTTGQATIETDTRAKSFLIEVSKDGFVYVARPVSAVRANPTIKMEASSSVKNINNNSNAQKSEDTENENQPTDSADAQKRLSDAEKALEAAKEKENWAGFSEAGPVFLCFNLSGSGRKAQFAVPSVMRSGPAPVLTAGCGQRDGRCSARDV